MSFTKKGRSTSVINSRTSKSLKNTFDNTEISYYNRSEEVILSRRRNELQDTYTREEIDRYENPEFYEQENNFLFNNVSILKSITIGAYVFLSIAAPLITIISTGGAVNGRIEGSSYQGIGQQVNITANIN